MLSYKKLCKLLKLIRCKLWIKGLFNGIAATIEHENIIKNTNPETIIDIGSNKGQFILLIEQLFPNKIIHSFEPIKEILEKQKKFFNYKKEIFFYNFALGSYPSTKEFFVTQRMDGSSFFKINSDITQNINYKIKDQRNIQIKTLDEMMLNQKVIQPILIKIDVQGFELEVLKGSEKILKKTSYLLIEVSEKEMYQNQPVQDEIIAFLKDRNFHILKQSLATNTPANVMQKDILFYKELNH